MDSRFSHLYKRDSSVAMIRVKMSRRRSQTLKKNREDMQNLRRHLDQLPEMDHSLDVSNLDKSVLPSQETGCKPKAVNSNSAVEERKKMLARYKENKAMQKEKEKRENEKKGTFKVGLYRPQPLGYLPLNPVVQSTKKTAESLQSTRVTRSMKQNPQPEQPAQKQPAPKKEPPSTRANKAPAIARGRTAAAKPVVGAPTTRSAAKTTVIAAATTKSEAKPAADLKPPKTRSANKQSAAPPSSRGKPVQRHTETMAVEKMETKVVATVNSSPEQEKITDEAKVTPVSFAPQGFVFQPPSGLRTFQPTPLSPRSANSFLSSSLSFEPQMESTNPVSSPADSSSAYPSPPSCMSVPCPASSPKSAPSHLPPASSTSPPASLSNSSLASPSPAPVSAGLPTPPTLPPASPSATLSAPQHDVPYFRAIMASETEKLTGLSEFWELRFDDSSIPEEIRDRMRTAVGQARLLMKERFVQFSGLVDDCDFGRGEKITTCTDLQGFWDMVYFQVEDVKKKFNALKEAEARGWQEEIKPVTRLKKVIKKPPVPEGKTRAGVGASAAAKSRLAAVKAAMKAKQSVAAKETETSDRAEARSTPDSDALANTLPFHTVVFHGGFFQVESPIKVVGAVRRSSRLSTVPFNQCSPHGSKFCTPGRQQRAVMHPSPHQCILTPSKSAPHTASLSSSPVVVALTTVSPASTPKQLADPIPCSPKLLHDSPELHRSGSAPCASPNGVSLSQFGQPDHNTSLDEIQSDLTITPVDVQMTQSAEIKLQDICKSEEEMPVHLPADSSNNTEPEESSQESAVTVLSQVQTKDTGLTEVDMFHSDNQAHAASFTESPSARKTSQTDSVETCVLSSPCMMSTTPQPVLSPTPSDKTDACVQEKSLISADCKVTENQHSESVAGLDFERYLQPTSRCSLSPVQSMAVDRFSLGLEDAEMESPQAQAEEPLQDALMTPTAFPRMAPLMVTSWTEEMIADQLLFTPEKRERVRPSMCQHDLIMFTPPDDI